MKVAIKNLQRKVTVNQRRILPLIKRLGELLNLERAELSVVFVNDRRSKELNRIYRGIDSPTDVLSFPMYNSNAEFRMWYTESGISSRISRKANLKSEGSQPPTHNQPEEVLLGDIVINLHKALRQSKEHKSSLYDELTILFVHGLLHLIGYNHERNRYQATKMRTMEMELLGALKEMA